jgi:hypothetical protein
LKHFLYISTLFLGLTSFVNAQIPSYVPSNGLIGWWPFNGNANDISINGNHGTVNGATLTTDRFAVANMAYSFDGVDDFINTPNQSLSGSVTFSAYYKMSSYTVPGNDMFFISNQSTASSIYSANIAFGFRSYQGQFGHSTYVSAPLIGYYATNNLPTANVWHHIVCVFENGAYVKMFLDNVLIYQNNSVITNSSLPSLPILIGGTGTSNLFYYNGQLDDIGIWNRALTECEIHDLYQSQLGSQAISAGADQSICAGDNVTLNGAGGSNYQWNNNVLDGQAFTPNQSANYVLNGTDSLGCQGTDTVVVTVLDNATSTLTQTALDAYTLNGQTYTQSGTYTQTLIAANGCDSTITLNLTLNFTGMEELGAGAKKLVKITDLNGKIIPRRKNTLMLYIYEDGTVERVVEME